MGVSSQPDVAEVLGSSYKFLGWNATVTIVGRIHQVASCQVGPRHHVIGAFQGKTVNATGGKRKE